jgi:hypothetical protein
VAKKLYAQMSFERGYNWLADYNSERARGIVHTPEWDAKMKKLQEQYDADPDFHSGGKRE